MGSVGDFLMGGNKQKSTSQNQSQETSLSQNQNVQGSQSTSNQQASNTSGSANQAYGALNAALNPTLGYVSQGGNMIGALLGLPPVTKTYGGAPTSVLPPTPAPPAHPPTTGTGSSMIDTLLSNYLKSQAAPTPTPTPTPGTPGTSIPPGSSIPAYAYSSGGVGSGGVARTSAGPLLYQSSKATGGQVSSGSPTLVGEQGPEVFVPHASGTVVPNPSTPAVGMVPGVPGSMGLNPGGGIATPGGGGTGFPLQGPGGPPLLSGLFGNRGGRFGGGGYGGFGNRPPVVPPVGGGNHPPAPAPGTPPINPTSALDAFTNSDGMNFILDQGQKAISGASAGNGTFDSGATGKALEQYGQNIGKSYLDDYMNRLLGYSQLGLGSASALSGAGGVSQNVGSSSGGSNSSSFGYGNGSSNLSSSSSGTGSATDHSKNGLLPDLAAFHPGSGSGG